MNHKKSMKSTFFRILIFVAILFSYTNLQSVKAQENRLFFTFNPISEAEFRKALKDNYNAPFVTEIGDFKKLVVQLFFCKIVKPRLLFSVS
jgi:hypothetical protein